jgi:hypothetical protein
MKGVAAVLAAKEIHLKPRLFEFTEGKQKDGQREVRLTTLTSTRMRDRLFLPAV